MIENRPHNPGSEDKTPAEVRIERRVRELIAITKWQETSPLSADQLEEILSSPDFGNQVVEGILRTEIFMQKGFTFGQEHGFVVFSEDDGSYQLGPLFEGDERSINLYEQTEEYKVLENISGQLAIKFHTHPNINHDYYTNTIFGGKPKAQHDFFSQQDLTVFHRIARYENTGLVNVLGLQDRQSKKGKLLLTSFKDPLSLAYFDPETTFEASRIYKQANKNRTPISIYEKAGLNAAQLSVDLNDPTPLDLKQVERVSKILTRRAS